MTLDGDLVCSVCGEPVDLSDADAEAEPEPLCGECYRAREFDELLWEAGE